MKKVVIEYRAATLDSVLRRATLSFPIRKVIASILFWVVSAQAQTASSTSQYERWGEMLRRENHQTVITETTAELARNPNNALALRMRAQAYANVEQVELALQDRDAIAPLVANPVTAEEYEALCYAYRSSDKHSKQEAIAFCNKAIELNPRAICILACSCCSLICAGGTVLGSCPSIYGLKFNPCSL